MEIQGLTIITAGFNQLGLQASDEVWPSFDFGNLVLGTAEICNLTLGEDVTSPQLENGYIPIAIEIAEALCQINLSAYESRILWFLFRQTYGWQKKSDAISLSQFSKATGIDRRHIHRTLRLLSSRQVIVVTRTGDRKALTYEFQKDYSKWRLSPIQGTPPKGSACIGTTTVIYTGTHNRKESKKKKEILLVKFRERFWPLYPRKVAKDRAMKAWYKLDPSDEVIEAIQKDLPRWRIKERQFVPHPATYLNDRRWEDEDWEDLAMHDNRYAFLDEEESESKDHYLSSLSSDDKDEFM